MDISSQQALAARWQSLTPPERRAMLSCAGIGAFVERSISVLDWESFRGEYPAEAGYLEGVLLAKGRLPHGPC